MLSDAHEETKKDVQRPATCQCIDWYAEGQSRAVDVGGIRIVIRFVGRRGRRGRICIEAPAGAVFLAYEQR